MVPHLNNERPLPPPAQADRRRRTVLVPPPPGRPACGHGLNHGGRGEGGGGWADIEEAVLNVVDISDEAFKGESYTLYVKGYPFIMSLLRVRFTP